MSPNPLILIDKSISACVPPSEGARSVSLDIRRHESLFFTNAPAVSGISPSSLASRLGSDSAVSLLLSFPPHSDRNRGNLLYFDLSDSIYDNIHEYFHFSASDCAGSCTPPGAGSSVGSGACAGSPCLPGSDEYLKYVISVILTDYTSQPGPLPPEDRPLFRILLYCLYCATVSETTSKNGVGSPGRAISANGAVSAGLLREIRLLTGKMLSSCAFSCFTPAQRALLRAVHDIL